MLTKPSNLKAAIAILVFLALFASYNIPGGPFVQKIIQVVSLAVCLFFMFVIMRNPEERNKKVLNIILTVLLFATMIAYVIAK